MTLGGTSFRSFLLYPAIVMAWEFAIHRGLPGMQPWFVPLMVWGYLQYRLVGRYRLARGGGGPGMETPPERLVTTGPFALCRNPMYLGHIIFLIGLALVFESVLGALIAAGTAVWLHLRVRRDERCLLERFGQSYVEYGGRVRRWIPGVL